VKNSELFNRWQTFHKGLDARSIQIAFANHLEYSLSKDQYTASTRDLYHALALTVRDRLVERWIRTQQTYYNHDVKMIYYLSAEYLLGRALTNNLLNLGNWRETVRALAGLHIDMEELVHEEHDAGLGNGGLGRLAACFMDSLASVELPAVGYGIRYEFGMFEQVIRDHAQVEYADEWLKDGYPWEMVRPERSYTVRFYGRLVENVARGSRLDNDWVDTQDVIGLAHDTPVIGYDNNTVNTLRLWSARATKSFDLAYFQHGDYLKSVEEKNLSENISKVLYPNDNIFQGQELRLKQQYFFVSCSIQDIIRRYLVNHATFDDFPSKVAIQLNDTHPSLAIAELMRIFLDEYHMTWETAWDIVNRTFAYTNHTILSEALERWPVGMLGNLLPRHLKIIYEINRRFLIDVSVFCTGDPDRIRRMSLVEEGPEKKIRMAHLAIVGSQAVNGVSELHTRLLRDGVFADFNEFFPERIHNVTNGITPRRWMVAANPRLASLISERIGLGWTKDLRELRRIEEHLGDATFRQSFAEVKLENKRDLASLVRLVSGLPLDPEALFDVQVKRFHEYKRQLLNLLHVVARWLDLKDFPHLERPPRLHLFAGMAAPAYVEAKATIRLINHVADMINRDPATADRLRVIFLPNYRVSLAETIIPAADVSEQISTAGYEASGTGNMKLALNGALTMGTLDGANVEILKEVGAENLFIFGLTVDEVRERRASYEPWRVYEEDARLKRVVDLISSGFFNRDDPGLFRGLMDSLIRRDPYLVLADFEAYRLRHEDVDAAWADRDGWTTRAILNVARCGTFSSDRAILDYNRLIWKAEPVPISREQKEKD
jgi:starch phosphorylase